MYTIGFVCKQTEVDVLFHFSSSLAKMDDVASVRSEAQDLRKIQTKLMQWDNAENPVAPLTKFQTDVVYTLTHILTENPAVRQLYSCWNFYSNYLILAFKTPKCNPRE